MICGCDLSCKQGLCRCDWGGLCWTGRDTVTVGMGQFPPGSHLQLMVVGEVTVPTDYIELLRTALCPWMQSEDPDCCPLRVRMHGYPPWPPRVTSLAGEQDQASGSRKTLPCEVAMSSPSPVSVLKSSLTFVQLWEAKLQLP